MNQAIEADFVGMENNHAVFRASDGTTFHLPLSIFGDTRTSKELLLRLPRQQKSTAPLEEQIQRLNLLIHEH